MSAGSIERMIALLAKETKQISVEKKANIYFLMAAIDFIRTYADRTHHGKEEDVLFRELAKKPLAEEHGKIMNELVEEHVFGRKTTAMLAEATNRYEKRNTDSLEEILSCLNTLVDFYPKHIEKEDKYFFFPILDYLSKTEQDDMLNEFWEFDRKIIHEKYGKVVEKYEK